MECLYAPDLTPDLTTITLTGDEYTHAKALRLRLMERLYLSNGRGLLAEAEVQNISPKAMGCHILRILPESNMPGLILALGILENRERMEFAVEKCAELGMTEFIPLQTRFSQRREVNCSRLQAKALAAMKQAQRAYLPAMREACTVVELLEQLPADTLLVLADKESVGRERPPASALCILIGPEGGFSPEEMEVLSNDARVVRWQLGDHRLRAETAAIAAVTLAMIG